MIHVIEVISDTNIGGAGRLLLARLQKTDHQKIRTAVILPKGSLLKRPLLLLGIHVEELAAGADLSFDPKAIIPLVRIIRRLRPDLVHAHGSLSARIAAKLCNVPVSVYTRHCAYPLTRVERMPLVRLLHRWLCDSLSDRIIAVSPAAKKNLLQLGVREEQIVQIINGSLPLHPTSRQVRSRQKQRLGIPDHATVVGICARLEPCKDHACFLRAAKLLTMNRGRIQDYRFLIVGDGSLGHALKRQSHQLGLAPYTVFTGFLKDPSPMMNLFDINVNCSIGTETSSLALSEGMSLGIPAVASDYGGNVYMVRNGENGFLYRRGDAAMLADRIRLIAEHPGLKQRMSVKAKARFDSELNAEYMTKEYERLYASLVRQSRKKTIIFAKRLVRTR